MAKFVFVSYHLCRAFLMFFMNLKFSSKDLEVKLKLSDVKKIIVVII